MDPQLDPAVIPVDEYEEDNEESFIGPQGLTVFFNEEDEEEEDYYDDGEAYQDADPLERSAAQRADTDDAAQAETVSGHTQMEGHD